MSKKKGAAKRKRRKALSTAKQQPQALLEAVANAMNACEDAGMKIRIIPGPVILTERGVILPPWKEGKKYKGWDVRSAGRWPKSVIIDSNRPVIHPGDLDE